MSESARLRRWQGVTAGTLFAGYAGYYVCRSNLSVAAPLLLDEYKDAGLTKGHVGDIASAGVLMYAAGKSLNGVATEYAGGRRMFLLGMFASVACTLLFVAGPELVGPAAAALAFGVAWGANRFVQSMGWGGLLQIAGRWFPPARLGTVMGVLCLSYLLGDAAARLLLGGVVWAGGGWRGVFLAAAAVLAGLGVTCAVVLKGRPADVGLPDAPPSPGNVYGGDPGRGPVPLRDLLAPLLRSATFWLVCLMNAGLTLVRETFNLWTPTYLKDAARLDAGAAGALSFVFPLVGAGSALLGGWLADRSGGRYGRVAVPFLVGLTAALAVLAAVPVGALPDGVRETAAVGLLAAVAFFLLAPYTFCSGALAVRLGGQRGGAAAAGLIDTVGYLGAVAAGSGVGRVADAHGWAAAFVALAAVAAATLVVAVVYAARGGAGTMSDRPPAPELP